MLRRCATLAVALLLPASVPVVASAAPRFRCPISAARLSAAVGQPLRKARQEARGPEGSCVFSTAVRRQLSITFLLALETMRAERTTWVTYLPELTSVGIACPGGLVDRPDLGRAAFAVFCRSETGTAASLVLPGVWTITVRMGREARYDRVLGARTLDRAAAAAGCISAGAASRSKSPRD